MARGGSRDGRLIKISPPDATVPEFLFSGNNEQWSETYTLLKGELVADEDNPDLVWPVFVFTERRAQVNSANQ
jgi:hypothetical protein